MRYAIGRVLWLVPVLLAVSLLVFWGLSSTAPRSPLAPYEPEVPELPLFFNANPRDVRQLSLSAMQSIAADDARANESAGRLVRLGGAALPHVLPALDTLAPDERARVALALAPVARRMGLGTEDELSDADAAMVFWRRFWEDRAIDFRPVVARRSVERAAERDSAARRADIVQLDTYALPDLIRSLDQVGSERDLARAVRITTLLADVTETDWRVSPDDTVERAADVVRRWRRWWARYGAEYVTYDGPQRLYAMVVETKYGKWATEAATAGLGITASGKTVVEIASAHAPWTLWLLAWGLFGGYTVGLAVGLASGARAPGPLDTAISITAIIFAALPAAWIASWWVPGPRAWGPGVMVLTVAALVSRYHRSALRATLDAPPAQLLKAHGASRWQVTTSTWHNSGYVLGSLVGVELPMSITAAFVVEQVLGIPGLSTPTVAAVVNHDVAWLMALALTSTGALGLAQIVGDSVLALTDPRVRAVLSPRREAWE
jgi:peptide/nickel transport system permease protein